jgi:hypothetical protein
MNKIKWTKLVLVVVCACGIAFPAQARRDEVTLVMVPRDEATVQVGMDIANRYPTLLVSYKVAGNGTVSLHGWTGTQWVNITLTDFKEGNFFKTGPDSALIIETETEPVADLLVPPEDWCLNVSKITTTQKRPLIHLVGQYYDFEFKDWQWFTKRYSIDMDAINPEGLNVAWYHKRLNDHLNKESSPGTSDLQYWISIRQAVLAEPPVQDEAKSTEVEMSTDEDTENPLTNDVPTAVVLGAGDVPEEHQESAPPTEENKPETESPAEMQ